MRIDPGGAYAPRRRDGDVPDTKMSGGTIGARLSTYLRGKTGDGPDGKTGDGPGGAETAGDGGSPRGSYYVAALVVCVVILGLVLFQYVLLAPARSSGLVPTSEPLTELYFTQPNALPAKSSIGQRFSFAFTIENLEGSSRLYAWSANFVTSQTSVTLASGTTRLRNLQSAVLAVRATPRTYSGAGLVEVHLAVPNQTIDFHLDVVPGLASGA